MSSRQPSIRAHRPRRRRLVRPILENLENRLVLSSLSTSIQLNFREFHPAGTYPAWLTPSPLGILPQDNGFAFPVGYEPQEIQAAYGSDKITFGGVIGDGTGQTIAIVDAYDDPAFLDSSNANYSSSDLAQFDAQLGLPDPPSFTKFNQSGSTSNLPGTDPAGAGNLNGNWEIEEALDIEWAHALAPGAAIDLVEASNSATASLFAAVATAAKLPGVSVVSMSWGLNEYSQEQSLDSTFLTPNGHQGVTFLAASGDLGGFAANAQGQPTTTPGILYPAASPNVVAVGGTTLQLNADGTYNSEIAWSGSGGGTSLYVPQPTYQQGVQQTGFRTIPDVSFDADPNTGVAVYDSYNDTDNSGPWVEVGGTSLAAPAWAGLIAIANQGRVIAGATTLDGSGQTLPALYAISPNDFNDITTGNNGVFSAGPGYDEVTGLGTPKAEAMVSDLSTYGTANHIAVTSEPPSSVIVGDSFGIVVSAENPAGGVDPAFSGTLTISLDANHPGATLGGTLTATADHGVAVFYPLTLNQVGSGYTIQVTSSTFPSITTNSFDATPDLTPWQGTFYPVPTDASLRAAINQADSNALAFNTIILSASTYLLSDASDGGLVIENSSTLPSKTLTITGQGETSSVIGSAFNWHDRIFEIEGSGGTSLNVTMQNLTIQGGSAQNGGVLGGDSALGGGLLLDDANVTLANVLVQNNQVQGAAGSAGAAGAPGAAGATGGDGKNASGGGIYLASGTLSLLNDIFRGNFARGGKGGQGGTGGGQGTKLANGVTGGQGGQGGSGGSAAGGAIYAAGGSVILANDTFGSNQAVGGPGGQGGTGGSGGRGDATVVPPIPGKQGGAGGLGGNGGPAFGGAIYLGAGAITLTGSTVQNNSAVGGAGGHGGGGGPGTAEVSTLSGIFGGGGTLTGLTGITGLLAGRGGPGGNGGLGGTGASGAGGGLYVAGGTLSLVNTTLDGNQALGGQGGVGGRGGTGGFGAADSLGLPVGEKGGDGGTGGSGGSGYGGGIKVSGGAVTLFADTVNGNIAQGGKGGTGGSGGSGPIAAVFGGGTGIGTGTGTKTGTGGTGGGTAANTAGAGGNGGNGGEGDGGGLYVSGGTLTLTNDTIAGNSAEAGSSGTGGPGGKAGTGTLTGGPGSAGAPGDSFGGGLYVNGGVVNLFNATIALNIQNGSGGVGGVIEAAGTVTAVSTIFADNGPVDYSGDINATDSLFQTAPINGTLSGSGNIVGSDPLLDPKGLQNNGGPTQTIALQAHSPAIGVGANPENLVADQRGSAPRTGPGGTDVGAYQTTAVADTTAPTTTLQATNVTSSNAGSLDPYTFTITYRDNVAISVFTLPGATVQVATAGIAPINATVVSIIPVGSTDAFGDAAAFTVTYQITPPGGSWTAADNGTYTVTLGGTPITDLAGNSVTAGTVGTFIVSINANIENLVVTSQPPSSVTAGNAFGLTVSVEDSNGTVETGFNGSVTIALESNPGSGTLNGTLTVNASAGVATFSGLSIDQAANGYTIQATTTGLSAATTNAFDITPAAASELVITTQPPASTTAGNSFGLIVTAEDLYGNLTPSFTSSVTVALKSNPGSGTLNGTLTVNASAGVATFSGLSIDQAANGYTIQATTTGLSSATTNAFDITPAAASQLVVTTEPPASITAGNSFGLTVSAEDLYGNLTPSFTSSVTVALKSNPGSGTLNGTLTVNASAGVAVFSGLSIDQAANGYTIQATTTGLSSATTNAFDITPAAASQLVVTTQPPASTTAGNSFGLTVSAEDLYGNLTPSFTSSITVALKSNPGSGTLNGTLTVNASAGVATFSGLSIDQAANGYTIQATTTGLSSATTNAFDITPAAASQLVVTTQPPASTTAGNSFGLTVSAEDLYGNLTTSFTSSVTVALKSNPGSGTLNGTLTVNASAGVAVFSGLSIDQAANGYTIQATTTGLSSATTNAFDITPAAASQLVVTTEPPASTTAGNSFGLTVSAEDLYGNLTPSFTSSVTVALKSNPGSGTLNGTLTVNASAGVAVFSGLSIDQAANGYTIQATTTGLSSATTNAFDITPAAASQLVVTTEPPASTTAGNSFGLTVSAEDLYGNLTASFTSGVTVALKSNPGSGTLNGTLTVSASAGVAVFSGLSIDQAANGYTIQATTTGLSSATTNAFDITPAAASQLVVTTQPPFSTTAGNSFGLTVSAEDLYGNLTPSFTSSVTVALKSNPGSGTLNGTLTVSASAGVAVFSGLSIDQAANGYTIQATTTGLSSATTNAFDITPAAASQLVVTTKPPASTTAGNSFGLSVSAEDLYGNLTASFTSGVTVALKSNPGSGALNGTLTVSASAGVAVFSGLSIDQAANGYTIQATTTGLSSATTNAFDITPAAASQLVVTTQPPFSTTAGNSFGLTVSAEDLYGNLTPSFTSSVTVALKSNPGSGTLNGTLTVSASAGVAVFSGLSIDQAANGYTIQATTTGLSSATTNAFDITPAAASQLVVTTEPPASTTAGNSFGLTVSAEDLYGNLTPSFTSSVTVALKSNPGSGTLNGTLTVNASAGVAVFAGLSIDQAANGYTIQATTTGLSSATTNAFDITPAAASQLVVTTEPPASTTAGNSFGLTVSAEDLYGNLTASFTSSVTVALKSNPGSGTLNGTLTVNASAGVAVFSGLSIDQAANGYTIQATTTGLSSATTNAFDITPAAASQLVVTTEPPASTTAGNSFGLTVSAEDLYGNLTPSFTSSVTVALKSNPGSGTLNGTLTVNASAGVAVFSGLSIDQAANGYTIQATTTGLSSATTNAFDITPAAASKLVVTTQPPASTAAGSPFGLTISAEDLYGNLTPSFTSSVTIALESNPGDGTLNGTLTINASAGVAAFAGLTIDQAANGYTIQATTTGGPSATTTNPFDITPTATSQLVVTTQPPASTIAGDSFGLTVSVEDNNGNLQTGFTGSVTIALESNPGSGALNGALTVNASAGVAVFAGLTLDQAANGYTIQATTTGLSSVTTNAFDITPAAASQLVVTTEPPASTTAGSAFGLTVSAEDLYGNLTPSFTSGVAIALKSNPGSGTLNGTLILNASAGLANFSGLTLDQAANGYTIQATTTGLSSATTNAFDITPAAATQLVVTTQPPASTTAGSSFGLTVSAEDLFGNLTPSFTSGVTIALKSNPGSGTLNGTLILNASAGLANFSGLTLDQAANGYTIQATTTGLSSATTNAFDITPAAASQLVVTTEPPASTTAGSSFGLTVSAEDLYGNLTPSFTSGVTIALESNPGSGTLNGTLIVNASAGLATFSGLTIDQVANGYTIQATTTGLSSATTNAFDITPASTSQLVVTTQPPASSTAGNSFGLTVSVEDNNGNVQTGFTGPVTIALQSNPDNGTLNGTLTVNASAGVAVFSGLTLDQAANGYTIGATATGGPTSTITNAFDITPAAASQLVVTTQPPASTTAGTAFGLTISAEDPYGNLTPAFTGKVTIALKNNPDNGMLGGRLRIVARAGVATFSGLTLDQAADGYTIQATTTGLSSVTTSSFDITPAAPFKLVVTTQPPASITAGQTFGLTATVEDRYGNAASSFTGAVSISLKNNPGHGTLNGTLQVNAIAGVVTFSGLTLDTAANGYTIEVVAPDLRRVITSSFDVVPAQATQLVVTTQPPASFKVNTPFRMAVSAEDLYGNVVTSETGNVTIALKNNPGKSTLSGQLIVAFSSGVARFNALKLNEPGNGYTIQATTVGLTPAVTVPFDVTAGALGSLVLTNETSNTIAIVSALSPDVSVGKGSGKHSPRPAP